MRVDIDGSLVPLFARVMWPNGIPQMLGRVQVVRQCGGISTREAVACLEVVVVEVTLAGLFIGMVDVVVGGVATLQCVPFGRNMINYCLPCNAHVHGIRVFNELDIGACFVGLVVELA